MPSAAVIYSARREDTRAADDRQEARDARLFDHRRNAYAAYVQEARKYLQMIFDSREVHHEYPPDDWLSPLWDRAADVAMYGTAAADDAARKANDALWDYA